MVVDESASTGRGSAREMTRALALMSDPALKNIPPAQGASTWQSPGVTG